jgi:hypothetical protein
MTLREPRLFKTLHRECSSNSRLWFPSVRGALDEWLTGPESRATHLLDEYVAFSAMLMASDLI